MVPNQTDPRLHPSHRLPLPPAPPSPPPSLSPPPPLDSSRLLFKEAVKGGKMALFAVRVSRPTTIVSTE